MDGERFDALTITLASSASRRRFLKTLVGGATAGFLSAAGHRRTPEALAQVGLILPFQAGETWYYTNGPHEGGSSIDLAPTNTAIQCAPGGAEVFDVPDSAKVTKSDRWAVAAASGTAVVSNARVEIEHGGGLGTGYFHLTDIQVKSGNQVVAGQRLGRPSCACPQGRTSGVHLHFYVKQGGSHTSIVGKSFSGWVVQSNRTMTRGAEVRTESTGRCGQGCQGVRNDLISTSPAGPPGGQSCPSGQKLCSGECIPKKSCCASTDCSNGQICQVGSCACPSGTINCRNQCVPVCPSGQSLDKSRCQCVCPSGRVLCNGRCVDLRSDASNCGACGNACPGGACVRGACQCPSGLTQCGNACVDIASDPDNCSGCGVVCPEVPNATRSCVPTPIIGGACSYACQEGFGDCDGDILANGCETDLSADAGNCGFCGNSCADLSPNMICIEQTCACADGFGFCSGSCVPLGTIENCSRCGEVCDDGNPCTDAVCDPVVGCQYPLIADGTPCGPGQICTGGTCVSTTFDLVLSGGPNATDHIGIDDDLEVYLNGTQIFRDRDNQPGGPTTIAFAATNGDQFRVVAIDGVSGFCEFLSPLYLHRSADGAFQVLLAEEIFNDCVQDGGNDVFFDQTFTVALP